MGGTGEYRAQPEAMRAGVGNVGGIIMQGVSAVADLERMILAPSSFAAFGSAVAAANGALQSQQVTALRNLLSLLQQVNDLVKRSADAYQAADESVAEGYGGRGEPATPASAIWGSPHAGALAGHAVNDSAGAGGEPGSVGNVLRYMADIGLGELAEHPVSGSRFRDVADFNDWLGGDADNQARVGVVAVYSGTARDLGDVPGGVHDGDVVVVEPFPSGGEPIIGVAANNGHLYNHGLLDTGGHGLARVSVYRPAFS
ncbi:WXG100 family type VII secretion target [Amycolatopsis anabasis]|uniref:WXG100 family type VII secretion target n=1 Tax=Amycolatopsis anabasis TaxID=1840409 RepID=UPI00131BA094|nr:WXG100 family type VII secretion target [Amycolatopsis anabasis]